MLVFKIDASSYNSIGGRDKRLRPPILDRVEIEMNSSLKGRGSNQYGDKPKDHPTPADLVRQAEVAERMRLDVTNSSSALSDSRLNNLPDHALVGQFSQELDNHLRSGLKASYSPTEVASKESLRSVRTIARYEDAVMTNHPDAYGSAMIEAVYWSKQVKMNPELRREINTEGSVAARRHAAFVNILRDTDASNSDGKLTVDQLASNLDELYLTEEGTSAWGGGINDSARLQNRYAAASALAQREKNPESKKALLDQARQIKATLSERGIQRINL